jgi:hypothetical protein
MQQFEKIYQALPAEAFRKKKRNNLIAGLIFLLLAIFYFVSGIVEGKTMSIVGGVLFMLMFSIRFWDDYRVKPEYIRITPEKIFMQQTEVNTEVLWKEVTKAVYNGRHLDLYGSSSIRYTFNLHAFKDAQRSEILQMISTQLEGLGIQMKVFGKGTNPSPAFG